MPGFIKTLVLPKPDTGKRYNSLVCGIVKQKVQWLHFNSTPSMLVDTRDEQPVFSPPARKSQPSSAATDASGGECSCGQDRPEVDEGFALAATAPR
jgi:hypothetical protein